MSENKGIKSADVFEAYRQCGSIRATARMFGINKTTAKHHIDKMESPTQAHAQQSPQGKESFSIEQSDSAQTITSVSNTVRTLEDALGAANVDQMVWEVERHTINKWDMARGNQDDKWDAIELWQVKVWLRRRKQSVFVDPLQSLIDGIRKVAPKPVLVKRKSSDDPHLLVLGLFDAHFGKLAWAAEAYLYSRENGYVGHFNANVRND